MGISRRGILLGGLGAAAASGAAAWALDRYVIDHVEVANASSIAAPKATVARSGTSTVSVQTVQTGSGSDRVTYFVAEVKVSDATMVRSAFANDQFGTNIVAATSEIASDVGALLAINGDYYGFRDTGIVVRNGVAFRDAGVWNTLSFGPGLVDNGAVLPGIDDVEIDTNFGNHSVQGHQPRTGVGWMGTNHLVFIVVDGRSTGYSRGVTMSEFAQIFAGYGAAVAYNLDGGGSATMVHQGRLVNNPLGRGSERGTSDIIYVAGQA